MRTPIRRLFVVAIVAVGVAAACGKSSPSTPAAPNSPSSTVFPVRVTINGPTDVTPGQSVAYTAIATMTDGSQQDYTQKVSWSSGPVKVLSINATTGQATAGTAGDAQVYVSAPPPAPGLAPLNAIVNVLVLPPNTYRLTGKVLESGIPVISATVTVTTGIGAGQSAQTDYAGGYRLYGLAGPVAITVRKDGYDPITKTFSVTTSDVLDFPEAHQTNGFPVLAGNYTLTIAPDANCVPPGGLAPMPADLLKPRSYVVVMMQNGPELLVTVSADGFSSQSNHFLGRIQPTGIDFTIGDGYFGYYGPDDGFSIRLSATSALGYGGYVRDATRSGSTISGLFQGALGLFELNNGFYRLVGDCRMNTHKLTLTPLSTSSARLR